MRIVPKRLGILAFVAVALVVGTEVTAQQELVVDAAMAKKGKDLFSKKAGCFGCHMMGRKMAGPDLVGVTERRDLDWVRRIIKDPATMLETDSTAKALLKEYNGFRMVVPKLTDEEVEAVLHYLKQESEKGK